MNGASGSPAPEEPPPECNDVKVLMSMTSHSVTGVHNMWQATLNKGEGLDMDDRSTSLPILWEYCGRWVWG